MKILYLSDQTFLHGGIEKVLSQKANYLADVLGEEVFIVTHSQQGREPTYKFSQKITMLDLGINYEIGTSYFHPKNLIKFPKHKSALKKIFQKLKPDVVVSCSFGPDFYFLPRVGKNIPKIKEFHGSRYFENRNLSSFKEKLVYRTTKNAEKKYDQLVVLNPDEKKFYLNEKIAVIPNPAEFSEYSSDFTAKKILSAGRISPVKNFADLIEAFSLLSTDFPDWELHFFGEDYIGTQEKLLKQINQLGLEQKIKFKGITPDLKMEMQNYSIYGMTSETECFPMVLLESLSVGLPVISYNSPTGPAHILKNNSDSFLVPYKNLDIFTEKLRQLMSDENLRKRMGENAKENAKRFEISNVMQLWKNLFEKLISKN